jgi:hypothetical protein
MIPRLLTALLTVAIVVGPAIANADYLPETSRWSKDKVTKDVLKVMVWVLFSSMVIVIGVSFFLN